MNSQFLEWTVPLRPTFWFCSSSGSLWPDFLASALPSISLEEETSCTVSGPGASWTKVATLPSSLVNSSPLSVCLEFSRSLGWICSRVLSYYSLQKTVPQIFWKSHRLFSAFHCKFIVFFQLFTQLITGDC